jgi:cell division transport system ATP-binding protein
VARAILSGTPGADPLVNDAIAPLPLIVFDHVTLRFGDRIVLDTLSFVIARHEFAVLTGPAGSGKTIVIRLIMALERPTAGTITVAGQPLAALSRRTLPHLRRSIGLVPQEPTLLDDRSVLDNVALPAAAAGLSRSEARARAIAALQRVGLEGIDPRAMPSRMAGSVRQRVAIARALVNRPALLLVDEPTAHLDDAAATTVLQLLGQIVRAGVTVVLASHSPPEPMPSRAHVIRLAGTGA